MLLKNCGINYALNFNSQAERGVCHKGDEVEIVGLGSQFKTTLTGIGTLGIHETLYSSLTNFFCCRNVSQRTGPRM